VGWRNCDLATIQAMFAKIIIYISRKKIYIAFRKNLNRLQYKNTTYNFAAS
jgi:hypothetical protein